MVRPIRGKNLKLKVLGREFEGEPFFKRVSLNNCHNHSIWALHLFPPAFQWLFLWTRHRKVYKKFIFTTVQKYSSGTLYCWETISGKNYYPFGNSEISINKTLQRKELKRMEILYGFVLESEIITCQILFPKIILENLLNILLQCE